MNIAILEDDKRDMEHLRLLLETYSQRSGLPMKVETFSVGEKFLRAFGPGTFDLIFFDNYIGSGLGIDIARKVRLIDRNVDIVFVSMSAEFAISGFEVGALHYLIKPIAITELETVFERRKFKDMGDEPQTDSIDVVTEHESLNLPIASIQYIEVVGKTSLIHHNNKETKTYTTLEKLAEHLPDSQFLRTHKSFIVNVEFVKKMEKNIFILKNNAEIPIGRTHVVSCKRDYMKYLANK